MASNDHQCHCYHHLTPPATATTTCCCANTHHVSPPPPAPPSIDPLLHSISFHHYHHPPQNHPYAPPQNHHTQLHDYYHPPPPPQIHKKHKSFQKYHQQEDAEESLLVNPTVSSLIQRIATLESTLRCRKNSQRPSSLRDAAARTIQTHFRSFLVRRSITLRHLKELAHIKSALNNMKSSVSEKTHFDSNLLYRESMNLLIKLDSLKDSDPMIRDGKRSISREFIRFMELIDQISTESRVISVKNVRFGKNGEKSVVLHRERKVTASSSRVLGDEENERKLHETLKTHIRKMKVSSLPKVEEDVVEILESENPGKIGVSQIRIGCLTKSQGVVKSQPKTKEHVSFDASGNVYRFIKSNHSPVSTDEDDDNSSNGDSEGVEEISVPSKETESEEKDSSEMSGNQMDQTKNLGTRVELYRTNSQPVQEEGGDDDDEGDGWVFSAPLPARMEYRVYINKKQNVKQ